MKKTCLVQPCSHALPCPYHPDGMERKPSKMEQNRKRWDAWKAEKKARTS